MAIELIEWIEQERAERSWSMRELARRSELSVAMVSEVLNDNTNPGLKFCTGIARAFDVPPETVLRMAGKIPPRTTRQALVQEILFYFDRMEEDDQLKLIRIAWSLSREQPENEPIHGSA